MCGIFGITSKTDVAALLFTGLERLEYRGYDSCGVALLDGASTLAYRKGAGEVSVVRREERFDELHGNSGLGHTRWATHGRVSRVNAHPHLDGAGDIAIAHNGIIENHAELRQRLAQRGHVFVSETDSEVIAHLIADEARSTRDFSEAVLAAVRALAGTYAIGVISAREPGTLYAARRESPLLIGAGKDFTCFASDPLAFSALTSRVAFLQDGEMVRIRPDGYALREIATGREIARPLVTLQLDGARSELGSFTDFMSKEISENGTVTRTALSQPQDLFHAVAGTIQKSDQTYLTGMGTAYYVAVMAQYIFARWVGRYLPALSADELPYLARFRTGNHVIAVSQSGETYDTLKALRSAKTSGATTSAVLNVISSSMARETDRFIDQKAGAEICVLSTKSTVSQLVILMRLALELGDASGHLTQAQSAECRRELQLLPGLLDQLWNRSHDQLREIARRLAVIRNWFFIGRGIYHGLALEAALKFKEVTYSHAEGMPAGFLKHGTISLIDESMHTAIFLPGLDEAELRTQTLGAAAEINARGGIILAFQPEGIGKLQGLFTDVIEYPQSGPLTNFILALMQAQLFAYYTARALGRNVDKPRSLAKSVTVG